MKTALLVIDVQDEIVAHHNATLRAFARVLDAGDVTF